MILLELVLAVLFSQHVEASVHQTGNEPFLSLVSRVVDCPSGRTEQNQEKADKTKPARGIRATILRLPKTRENATSFEYRGERSHGCTHESDQEWFIPAIQGLSGIHWIVL